CAIAIVFDERLELPRAWALDRRPRRSPPRAPCQDTPPGLIVGARRTGPRPRRRGSGRGARQRWSPRSARGLIGGSARGLIRGATAGPFRPPRLDEAGWGGKAL